MAELDEGFDESDDITDADRVTLVDEDGAEMECVILAHAECDGAEYVLLALEEELAVDSDQPLEMMIFGYNRTDDAEVFAPIDDEETYNKVEAMFSDLIEKDAAEAAEA